jgi:hypothetical protein
MKRDTQQNNTQLNNGSVVTLSAVCADCREQTSMLSVIVRNAVMLKIVAPYFISIKIYFSIVTILTVRKIYLFVLNFSECGS